MLLNILKQHSEELESFSNDFMHAEFKENKVSLLSLTA